MLDTGNVRTFAKTTTVNLTQLGYGLMQHRHVYLSRQAESKPEVLLRTLFFDASLGVSTLYVVDGRIVGTCSIRSTWRIHTAMVLESLLK